MFQTFTGSSRRPRQVNLSGQNANPFAASTWNPAGAGTQQTVANAERERQQRQQERDRLSATKKIQRVWRGHRARRHVADARRATYDKLDKDQAHAGGDLVLVQQARLLLTFFASKRKEDVARLVNLGFKISNSGLERFVNMQEIQPQLLRLATVTLEALHISLPQCPSAILSLLMAIINHCPNHFPRISRSFYTFLSALVSTPGATTLDQKLLLEALRTPLVERIDSPGKDNVMMDTYANFALHFLTAPNLVAYLGQLDVLAEVVNFHTLSATLVREFSTDSAEQIDNEKSLWLLAHFIALHRLQKRDSQEPDFLRALSLQLSRSSNDILGRVDTQDSDIIQDSDETSSTQSPLPSFVTEELLSLVNKASISGLLAKFNIDYGKASSSGEEDASLLASYALTLLRIFPRRGDEIRMWLYLGSMTTSNGGEIPALKFFWQAMSSTTTFSTVATNSNAALALLKSQTQRTANADTTTDIARDREWRTILLFLELYTFVLRFTDDEEFLSGGKSMMGRSVEPVSRIRDSALGLQDVQRLTIFLKNLAFTTYYNAESLLDDGSSTGEAALGTYFGTTNTLRFVSPSKSETTKPLQARPFAGIAGMTFDYVRSVVTGVMRMLYERDSRRGFLPKDHWLMTSRFEMEGFIPAVVMEEERQHRIQEEGEDADLEDDAPEPILDDLRGLAGMARSRRAHQIEATRKQQQKLARQKVMAAIGPRLEVLQNMPFVIPFETRVQIFRQFVDLDQTRRRGGNVDPDIWRMSIIQQSHMNGTRHNPGHDVLSQHHAKIRRDQIFDDALEQFYGLGDGLKEPIQITFVDQFDTVEAGIDGGGVTKEFLTSITKEAFRSGNQTMFVANDQNLLYPNPAAIDERRELLREAGLSEKDVEWREEISKLLREFEFLGRVIGKCLYEGILVDIGFAGFFLLKWATAGGVGYRANINDLRDFDESLYQGLLKLKNYPGNVEDLGLDFTIVDEVTLPASKTQTITRELLPNGSNIPVTNENRPLYVSHVARHRLQVQPFPQTRAFLNGLSQIINPSWLSMFNQSELQTLIGGDSSGIDVEDLRQNTQYGGVYVIGDDGEEHPTIKLFWKVMHDIEDEDRRKVLKYVTSTPRAPLLGFSQLNPRFSIRDSSNDEARLPSTSTCVNLLKLPRYSTEETLRAKLLYAVNSGAGFDLS